VPFETASRPHVRDRALDVLFGFLLVGAFLAVYASLTDLYRRFPGYYEHLNVLFGEDQLDAIHGWVQTYKGTHPFQLLIVLPLSVALSALAGGYERGLAWYAAGSGALLVGAVYALARRCGARGIVAVPLAIAFGASMSQLVFASLADTYMIAALATVPAYFLLFRCLADGRPRFWLWVAAATFAFGVTATQAAPVGICFGILLVARRPRAEWLPRMTALVAATGFIGVSLAVLQRLLVPGVPLFFDPDVYLYELHAGYIAFPLLHDPLFVLRELAKTFFVFNVMSPLPAADGLIPGLRLEAVLRDVPLTANGAAPWALVALWLALLAIGAAVGIRARESRPIALAALLSVAWSMLLHTVYGTYELFLYTPHFTFLLFVAAASGARHCPRAHTAAFWVLAAGVAWHGQATISRMEARFTGSAYPGGGRPTPLVARDAMWRYQKDIETTASAWVRPDFEDSTWLEAPGPLPPQEEYLLASRDLGEDRTVLLGRTTFFIDDPERIDDLWLDVLYARGFTAYLNGVFLTSGDSRGPLGPNPVVRARHNYTRRYFFDPRDPRDRTLRYFVDTRHLRRGRNVLAVSGLDSTAGGARPGLQISLTGVQ
jgi:hypothetical protein